MRNGENKSSLIPVEIISNFLSSFKRYARTLDIAGGLKGKRCGREILYLSLRLPFHSSDPSLTPNRVSMCDAISSLREYHEIDAMRGSA